MLSWEAVAQLRFTLTPLCFFRGLESSAGISTVLEIAGPVNPVKHSRPASWIAQRFYAVSVDWCPSHSVCRNILPQQQPQQGCKVLPVSDRHAFYHQGRVSNQCAHVMGEDHNVEDEEYVGLKRTRSSNTDSKVDASELQD